MGWLALNLLFKIWSKWLWPSACPRTYSSLEVDSESKSFLSSLEAHLQAPWSVLHRRCWDLFHWNAFVFFAHIVARFLVSDSALSTLHSSVTWVLLRPWRRQDFFFPSLEVLVLELCLFLGSLNLPAPSLSTIIQSVFAFLALIFLTFHGTRLHFHRLNIFDFSQKLLAC